MILHNFIQHMYPSSYSSSSSGISCGHVLIADDDECLRYLLKAIVEQAHYTVELAADGDVALTLFNRNPAAFTLALIDVNMPRITGDEVLRKIRAIRPDLPVILITGYETEAVKEWTMATPTAFLQKPFDLETVRTVLARFASPAVQQQSVECA